MVVSEAKIVFGLGDVVRVRFRCQHCGNAIEVRIGSPRSVGENCPLCNERWASADEARRIREVLQDIDTLRADLTKVQVELEIDAPEN